MSSRTFTTSVLLGIVVHSQVATTVVADYSIAATHRTARQVGGAAATCSDGPLYPVVYNSVPDRGVFINQAFVDTEAIIRHIKELGLGLLRNKADPENIIAQLTQTSVDPYVLAGRFAGPDLRQFGIVDLDGRSAGHTGPKLGELFEEFFSMRDTVQGDVQGQAADYAYSIQTDPFVTSGSLSNAENTFKDQDSCDLAEQLMLALEAGGKDGKEGDIRCVAVSGVAASGAFLHVDNPDGTTHLHLEVVDVARPNDAVVLLRERYDEWRSTCPCGQSRCRSNGDQDSPDDNKVVVDDESKLDSSASEQQPDDAVEGLPATTESRSDDDDKLFSNSRDEWEAAPIPTGTTTGPATSSPSASSSKSWAMVPALVKVAIIVGALMFECY